MIAKTPQPPYYAVIFSNIRTSVNDGYAEIGKKMIELASKQEGFLGFESARDQIGISVSYWKDLESIKKWKYNEKHTLARNNGRGKWYSNYTTRICKVERAYSFDSEQ